MHNGEGDVTSTGDGDVSEGEKEVMLNIDGEPEISLKDIQDRLESMATTDKTHIPKVDFFHGLANEDPKLWWQRFEQVAKFNKWTAQKTGDALLLYLRGPAERWAHLADTQKLLGNTPELKKAFLEKFQHKATTFILQTQFVERKMQPTETVEEFLTALQDIGQKLDKDEDDILGQFLRDLTPKLKTLVLTQSPDTLTQAAQMAMVAETVNNEMPSQSPTLTRDDVKTLLRETVQQTLAIQQQQQPEPQSSRLSQQRTQSAFQGPR